MSFDIFNPQVSKIASGMDGKVILVYGGNSTGKTKQATRMPKPFYLGFEEGIRAISGVPFLPINNWSDFKKINRQLTGRRTVDKARETYQTIIFDEVFTAATYCQEYLCNIHGVDSIGEGNNGYGLWQQYFSEFWGEINKLLKSGFTLYFIGHEQFSKDEDKIVPKGDARSMTIVRDNADIIAHVVSQGVDDEGRVVNSKAYFTETEDFFARSRFDYIDPFIESFTAENLEKAVTEAVKRQEEAEGVKAVTYEEQKESLTSEKLDFDTLFESIKKVGTALQEADKLEEVVETIEDHLGDGMSVADFKKGQEQVMSVVLDELEDILEETQQ